MRTITILLALLSITTPSLAQSTDSPLKINHLTGNFYIYTTYSTYKGAKIGANGMYLITSKGAVVFDTPWDTTQFQPLLDSIQAKHQQKVVLTFATHFHEDRTAGLEYFQQQGVRTYTTKQTDSISQQRGMKRAEFLMHKDTSFKLGQYTFQVYYPGHGHAPDNIVIWFPKERILYGGCLIKSTADKTLGNLGDASTEAYATTIKTVQEKCKDPKHIITGHNDWKDTGSLQHTLKLAEAVRVNRQ
jgi:metallo-beta-lactamase class B